MPDRTTTTFLLEAMSPCTETFFSRSYTYNASGTCLDDSEGILGQLEKCRKAMLEAVIWIDQTYVGGTWFDINQKKWTVEFFDLTWNTQNTCPKYKNLPPKYLPKP
ncbi:MAG: hypothetical protein PHO79_07500 [Desulfoplanes sp.]|nr:hypothetical protein [Desulfoplanes sp.]